MASCMFTTQMAVFYIIQVVSVITGIAMTKSTKEEWTHIHLKQHVCVKVSHIFLQL